MPRRVQKQRRKREKANELAGSDQPSDPAKRELSIEARIAIYALVAQIIFGLVAVALSVMAL